MPKRSASQIAASRRNLEAARKAQAGKHVAGLNRRAANADKRASTALQSGLKERQKSDPNARYETTAKLREMGHTKTAARAEKANAKANAFRSAATSQRYAADGLKPSTVLGTKVRIGVPRTKAQNKSDTKVVAAASKKAYGKVTGGRKQRRSLGR